MPDCCTPEERKRIQRWTNEVADRCVEDLDRLNIASNRRSIDNPNRNVVERQIIPYAVPTTQGASRDPYDRPEKVVRRYKTVKSSSMDRDWTPRTINVTVQPSSPDEVHNAGRRQRKARSYRSESSVRSYEDRRPSKPKYADRDVRPRSGRTDDNGSTSRKTLRSSLPGSTFMRRAFGFDDRSNRDLQLRGGGSVARTVRNEDVPRSRARPKSTSGRSKYSRDVPWEADSRKSSHTHRYRHSVDEPAHSYNYDVDSRNTIRPSSKQRHHHRHSNDDIASRTPSHRPKRSKTVYSRREGTGRYRESSSVHEWGDAPPEDVVNRVNRIREEVQRLKAQAYDVEEYSSPAYRVREAHRDYPRTARRSSVHGDYYGGSRRSVAR